MLGINSLGKMLIIIGIIITGMGIIFYFFGSNFSWVGHLPGDIKIEKENFTFYFPLTTMILISLVLNLLIRILNFFLH